MAELTVSPLGVSLETEFHLGSCVAHAADGYRAPDRIMGSASV